MLCNEIFGQHNIEIRHTVADFPFLLVKFKRISLLGACVLASGVALLVNRFINFPLYEAFLGMPAGEAFAAVWGLILAFNLIKTVSVSVLTLLLYKRLSNFFKKWKV